MDWKPKRKEGMMRFWNWFTRSRGVVWFMILWVFAWSTWVFFGFLDNQVNDMQAAPDGEHSYE